MVMSSSKMSVIPADANAGESEEQDQQHEEQKEEFPIEEEITDKVAGAQQKHISLPRPVEAQQGEWL